MTVTPSSAPASVPATGSGTSGGVAVSGDGRYVVVGTTAQLETSDTNTAYELYLVDRTAHTAHRIAPLAAGATGSRPTRPTPPRRRSATTAGYVALATTAALVARRPQRPARRLPLRHRRPSTWALASVPAGVPPPPPRGPCCRPAASVYATSPAVAMSADGDLVLFYSARADLVAGDTNGQVDLFAKRMSTGVVTRVSTMSSGAEHHRRGRDRAGARRSPPTGSTRCSRSPRPPAAPPCSTARRSPGRRPACSPSSRP